MTSSSSSSSSRQTYVSALKTTVSKGASRAQFTVRLPRIGGYDLLNSSMSATVLSVTAVEEPVAIVYGLRLDVKRTDRFHSFVLSKPFAVGVAPHNLAKRLRQHLLAAKTKFGVPANSDQLVPSVGFDAQTLRFSVRMPPGAGLYSAFEYFWDLLGVAGAEQRDKVDMTNKGVKAAHTVYGFWNQTQAAVTLTGDPHYANVTFADFLHGLQVQSPDVVRMQVEVSAETFARVSTPGPRSKDFFTASRVLEQLLNEASVKCGLDPDTFFATNEHDSVSVTNRVLEGSGDEYKVTFEEDTALLLDAVDISFEAGEAAEFEMKPPPVETRDAFAGRYPVTMLLQGSGQASHWIDTRGYCATLGTLHEKPRAVDAQSVVFDTDMMGLQLEFIDRNYDTVLFREEVTMTMMLRLTPVV
jgi:hypothetical protein